MRVFQTGSFSRTVKKLHRKDKTALDQAIRIIAESPRIGVLKKGPLAGVRVYKFKVDEKQHLLAYGYDKKLETIALLAPGSLENFCRDLAKP